MKHQNNITIFLYATKRERETERDRDRDRGRDSERQTDRQTDRLGPDGYSRY